MLFVSFFLSLYLPPRRNRETQVDRPTTTRFPFSVTRKRSPLKREKNRGAQRGDDQETENPVGAARREPGTHPRMTDGIFAYHDIAARIVSYIVEYTAPVWHRRHVDSRPRRAIHPPISPYHGHPPRTIPLVRPLNGQAKPPPWCSIIDTYPSRRLTAFQACCVRLDASLSIVQRMHSGVVENCRSQENNRGNGCGEQKLLSCV